jgi:hypothetical protein
MGNWYSLWKFGKVSRFGILFEEKSGNPVCAADFEMMGVKKSLYD